MKTITRRHFKKNELHVIMRSIMDSSTTKKESTPLLPSWERITKQPVRVYDNTHHSDSGKNVMGRNMVSPTNINNNTRRRALIQNHQGDDSLSNNNHENEYFVVNTHNTTHNKNDYKDIFSSSTSTRLSTNFLSRIKSYISDFSMLKKSSPSTSSNNDGDGVIYYEDNYNDLSWKCSCGTTEDDGIWLNRFDPPGNVMCVTVWILILYSVFTFHLLWKNNSIPSFVTIIYFTLCALALASHAKTVFTDPGAIPQSAVPTENDRKKPHFHHALCSICQCYKPKHAHHCRICNRCIAGMDHHCPWMNNCIGRANLKHFILFLVYIWMASFFALLVFVLNYFFCHNDEDACSFSFVIGYLVRFMSGLCLGALCFTSTMIVNVFWSVTTGIGTIDRLKDFVWEGEFDEKPTHLSHIFGIGSWYTWWVPTDPYFDDYDIVMGYSTTQRLLRERKLGQSV